MTRTGDPLFCCRIARHGGANDRVDSCRERLFAPMRLMRNPSAEMTNKAAVRLCAEAVALPGTWQFKEREGLKCEGNTFSEGEWSPERPSACIEGGWVRGVEIEPGLIAQDTADNIEKLFIKLPELYAQITSYALDVNNFRDQNLEEDGKNS